eukprot:TRINITY_DN60577_c0_g1_i1.p1 TRINITY_DN60577_c0_g1~~TRINITY_DN60577_c0_g1_i1.p1  ORF type:complete len:834 (+),score=174.48 TRINITY_DN60577_c0_g1_i1:103-2604(+)
MIRRPPRSTLSSSSAASDVYKRQPLLTWSRYDENRNGVLDLREMVRVMPVEPQLTHEQKRLASHILVATRDRALAIVEPKLDVADAEDEVLSAATRRVHDLLQQPVQHVKSLGQSESSKHTLHMILGSVSRDADSVSKQEFIRHYQGNCLPDQSFLLAMAALFRALANDFKLSEFSAHQDLYVNLLLELAREIDPQNKVETSRLVVKLATRTQELLLRPLAAGEYQDLVVAVSVHKLAVSCETAIESAKELELSWLKLQNSLRVACDQDCSQQRPCADSPDVVAELQGSAIADAISKLHSALYDVGSKALETGVLTDSDLELHQKDAGKADLKNRLLSLSLVESTLASENICYLGEGCRFKSPQYLSRFTLPSSILTEAEDLDEGGGGPLCFLGQLIRQLNLTSDGLKSLLKMVGGKFSDEILHQVSQEPFDLSSLETDPTLSPTSAGKQLRHIQRVFDNRLQVWACARMCVQLRSISQLMAQWQDADIHLSEAVAKLSEGRRLTTAIMVVNELFTTEAQYIQGLNILKAGWLHNLKQSLQSTNQWSRNEEAVLQAVSKMERVHTEWLARSKALMDQDVEPQAEGRLNALPGKPTNSSEWDFGNFVVNMSLQSSAGQNPMFFQMYSLANEMRRTYADYLCRLSSAQVWARGLPANLMREVQARSGSSKSLNLLMANPITRMVSYNMFIDRLESHASIPANQLQIHAIGAGFRAMMMELDGAASKFRVFQSAVGSFEESVRNEMYTQETVHRSLIHRAPVTVQLGSDPPAKKFLLLCSDILLVCTCTESDEPGEWAVSYTHLRAHETPEHLVCRLLLEKKKKTHNINNIQLIQE